MVKSVSLSECKHIREIAIQKNQPQRWRTDKKTPTNKKSNYIHWENWEKMSKRKCVQFSSHNWTRFQEQVLHLYASQMFSFVLIFTDQKHFSAPLRSASSRFIRTLQLTQTKHKYYGIRCRRTKNLWLKKVRNWTNWFPDELATIFHHH